jgi:eukaryotic-like serine/threonine-protein kinase
VETTRNLPRNIGRYEITQRIGKGAMGVVYAAHDGLMERTVAIKVMMTDLEDDPETSQRFYREARSAGQLIHPNIVTIFDMGQDDGRPFIVMEYLEGETLNRYLARPDAQQLEAKIDLMIQICEGLQAAHSHGIFHRDIKPGNLLVRSNGELKIVDFGIARLASSSITASGLIVGTPDYMSPEQARGHDVDQRSDIFSAGAVFYFMLTGRKPFASQELTAVLMKVQAEDPLPIRETEAPPALARVVMKALAKNPAERYQSCGQMIAELEYLKRQLEEDVRKAADEITQRLAAIESVAAERRRMAAFLDLSPPPADIEAERQDFALRRSMLGEPPKRAAAVELVVAVKALEESSSEEAGRWRRAMQAVEAGEAALASNRTTDAIAQLELAQQIEPGSRRASMELDRCRGVLARHREAFERAKSLLDEARKAAASKQWQVVIDFCDDAIRLDPAAEEAKALKQNAIDALGAQAKRARMDADRALDRAEAYRRKKRFQEAALEIARAREAHPENPEVQAADERLRQSIAEAERDALQERQAADAVARARSRFAAGERTEAVADLRGFTEQDPEGRVSAEIARLEQEARRLAEEERRKAAAADDASGAETALSADDPGRALELATRALDSDSSNALARKIAGLATAELKQRAEAAARAAAAAKNVEEARQQLARGKFQKARALVSAAAALNPENSQHKLVLASIEDEEKRLAAEEEQRRLARQRSRAVAPMLDRARAAEAQQEFERAVWTAENALAVDPDCIEAREILDRVKARLAANPRLADETVDLTNEPATSDPDDTVSLTKPSGVWERLAIAVRGWTRG